MLEKRFFRLVVLLASLLPAHTEAKFEPNALLKCPDLLEEGKETAADRLTGLEAAQARALRALRAYAATRCSRPENIPDVLRYPDREYREQGRELASRGIPMEGTLVNSPAAIASIADGTNRAFLILPQEGFLRVAEDDISGRHQALGLFQDVTVPGEITVSPNANGSGLNVALSPRSGSYYKTMENLAVNSYGMLVRALQAIWAIGVFPVEVTILDHQSRKPVFTLDLSSVRPG